MPGAVSAPATENLAPDGRFRPAAELADRFARLLDEPLTPARIVAELRADVGR